MVRPRERQETTQIQPPRHTPEDEYILEQPVSTARRTEFLKAFIEDRRQTATTEMLFERVGAFRLESTRPKDIVSTGFHALLMKGPFVEGSNWLAYNMWELAVGMERHLVGRLEQALRNATEHRLEAPVNRDAKSVLSAFDAMALDLRLGGYTARLFVLAGPIGIQLAVDLGPMIKEDWLLDRERALPTTHRVLGMRAGVPILDIAESPAPAAHAVDLARFAKLTRYGDEPEFAIEEFDRARAKELLARHPALITNPPPESGMEDERIRQLQLRVGLRLYETYELTVADKNAAVGRPLVGPVVD